MYIRIVFILIVDKLYFMNLNLSEDFDQKIMLCQWVGNLFMICINICRLLIEIEITDFFFFLLYYVPNDEENIQIYRYTTHSYLSWNAWNQPIFITYFSNFYKTIRHRHSQNLAAYFIHTFNQCVGAPWTVLVRVVL